MNKKSGAFRVIDHPRAGCHCPEHEEWRKAHREYMREYTKRKAMEKYQPKPTLDAKPVELPTDGKLRLPPFDVRVSIEQAVARGLRASQIMRQLGCSYRDVRAVWQNLDRVNATPRRAA